MEDYIKIDPNTGSTIGVFASSKQGKTELIKYLWKRYFKKDYTTIVCSPTIHSQSYDIFRKSCVVTEYVSTFKSLIQEVHYIQSQTNAKVFRFLFILDDCTTTREDAYLREMFLTLRNLNISTILSLQGCTLMNKHNRTSMNYGFFGRFLSDEGTLPIVTNFLDGVFPSKSREEKVRMYCEATKGYYFIFRDMLDGDRNCRLKIKLP